MSDLGNRYQLSRILMCLVLNFTVSSLEVSAHMKVSVGIDYLQSFSSLSLPAVRLQICVILVMGSEEISEKVLSRVHNLPVFSIILVSTEAVGGAGERGSFLDHLC